MNKLIPIEKNLIKYLIIAIFATIALGFPYKFLHDYSVVRILDYKNFLITISFLPALFLLLSKSFTKQEYLLDKPRLLLIIFFVYSTISYFWIGDDIVDKLNFQRKWLLYFHAYITIFLFVVSFDHKKHQFFLIRTISYSSLIISGIYFSQIFLNFPELATVYKGIHASTFGNANAISHVIVLSLPLSIYLIFNRKNFIDIFLGIISVISSILLVFFTQSSTGLLAIIFELFILLIWLVYKYRSFFKYIATLILMVSATFGYVASDKINYYISDFEKKLQNKDTPRKIIYNTTILSSMDKPLYGSGLGGFVGSVQRNGESIQVEKAHNEIINLYNELGLLGLLIFFSFLYYLVKNSYTFSRKTNNSDFIFFCYVSLLGSTITALFSWPYEHLASLIFLAILVAIILKHNFQSEKSFNLKLSKTLNSSIIIVISLIILISPYFYYDYVKKYNDVYTNLGLNDKNFNLDIIKKNAHFPSITPFLNNQASNVSINNRENIFKLVTSLDSDNAYARVQELNFAIENKDVKTAEAKVKKLEEIFGITPFTVDAELRLGVLKRDIESIAVSYKKLRDATIDDSQNFFHDYRYYIFLMRWAIRTENTADVLFAEEKFLETRDVNLELDILVGSYLYSIGEYEQAGRVVKRIMEKNIKTLKTLKGDRVPNSKFQPVKRSVLQKLVDLKFLDKQYLDINEAIVN